jgi:hypothetical protein
MSALFSGPQLAYLIIAVVVLALAFSGIVWVGRTIRGELGSGSARADDAAAPGNPATGAQVHAHQPAPAPVVVPKPVAAVSIPDSLPPAMASLLDAEKLRVWCPMCGTELPLPVFPPLVARCTKCGMKSAVRADEGGRYVVNVSPPPKIS